MSATSERSTQMTDRLPALLRLPLLLVTGVFVALLGALVVFIPALNPPGGDVRLLILFLSGTGLLTLSAAYTLYRLGLIRWFRSLRWTLLITISLTVLLIFLNVWVTARLMFISDHDLWLTTALLIFAGVTAIAFGVFVSNTMTERIRDLAKAAERLAQGDLEARAAVQGNDELAELADTFNWMAGSLQEADAQKRRLEQARRDLIAWVSHDLRTPLASMRAMIEAMVDGVVTDPETVARYLSTTQAEIAHLSDLIDDLFELAQIDVGHVNLVCEWTSLRDLLSDTLGSLQSRAEGQGVTLRGAVEDDIDPVCMAPDKIQRVLYNLLDNALRYTPSGGTITLAARSVGADVLVEVHNTGSHIAAAELPHVFERFFRGEDVQAHGAARRRGTGLGLAIAKGFVEAHGGHIQAASDPARGTTFSFTLPRSGPPGDRA